MHDSLLDDLSILSDSCRVSLMEAPLLTIVVVDDCHPLDQTGTHQWVKINRKKSEISMLNYWPFLLLNEHA